MERIVVIGGDAAGMSAASQALRQAKVAGREVAVTVLEAGEYTSYSACGIPYWVAGDVAEKDDLIARSPEDHRAAGIDLRTGRRATEVDLSAREVVHDGVDGPDRVPFDRLVVASGAAPMLPDWALDDDGSPRAGIGTVTTLDAGERWLDLMDRPSCRVVVVGGGYIGVEMAEAAVRRGHRVRLLTRSRVLSPLDPVMSEKVRDGMVAAGVDVHEGVAVAGLKPAETGHGTHTLLGENGGEYEADLVVVALGVTPQLGFLPTVVPRGSYGGLLPDPTGRVYDDPPVWAAGDCCEVVHRLTGERVLLPLGTHANKLGRVAGAAMLGGSLRFDGALGTSITRFVAGPTELEVAATGLSERDAEAAGLDSMAVLTEGSTASGYMSEAAPIAVLVRAERGTRRLLGVQVVGGRGAGKRVDAAAAALWGGLRVDDLAWMDLSYAPPFSTAWEIVSLAARRLAERLD